MAKKVGFIFPGQGSQFVGMGLDLYNSNEHAKNIFDSACEILGKNISDICFNGDEKKLKQTVNTQPAIVTTSIALFEALKSELDIEPDFVAGHSLGEYVAMYVAGVMDLENTLLAIQKRADLMSRVKGGSMSAIIGAELYDIKSAIYEASKFGYVDIANYNSPSQVVITGDDNAVKQAGDILLNGKAKRVIPLAVSGAFHSEFMKDAGADFSEFVKDLELNDAKIPVITNVDGEITTLAKDFREKMPRQIYSPVHWTQTIEKMVNEGVEIFVEIGPNKVLAGLNKKISPDKIVLNINNKETLEETIKILKEEKRSYYVRKSSVGNRCIKRNWQSLCFRVGKSRI